jgi:nitrate reductase NapE component
MAHLRHTLLRLLKKAAPPPRQLWLARRGIVLSLLALVAIALVGGIAQVWILELKDLLLPLLAACLSLAYAFAVWSLRVVLEKRPGPTERATDVAALSELIFEPDPAPTPGHRRLRRFRPRKEREIRSADAPELVEAMTRLNCRLFEQSVHGQGFDEKLARNRSHMEKNRRCIRLLGMTEAGRARIAALDASQRARIPLEQRLEWVGFSHVVPMNRAAFDRYVRRSEAEPGIEDVALDGQYVCAPGEPAHAFLIFTIALDGRLVKRWEPALAQGFWARLRRLLRGDAEAANRVRAAERALYVMAFEHLMELSHYHLGAKREIRVMAQAFAPSSARTLRALGFLPMADARTADEEPLYELIVRFP